MAKDKDRNINPAQAQRKADKAKALKKGKAQVQSQRNEKLARRNPERLQRQIDDLKALETSGDIKPREKAILAELERDVRAIRKARDTLGEKAPVFRSQVGGNRRDGGNVLGKRQHDGERKQQNQYQEPSESDTDEDVRKIPMPRDTPPPIPRPWKTQTHNANHEPLGQGTGSQKNINQPYDHPPRPTPTAQTTYSSAPQIRDLKQEAIKRFVPSVVRQKQQAVRGLGGLIEPEELDRLEREGYVKNVAVGKGKDEEELEGDPTEAEEDKEARRLVEEETRFQRELAMEMDVEMEGDGEREQGEEISTPVPGEPDRRHVEIEEVEDEDIQSNRI